MCLSAVRNVYDNSCLSICLPLWSSSYAEGYDSLGASAPVEAGQEVSVTSLVCVCVLAAVFAASCTVIDSRRSSAGYSVRTCAFFVVPLRVSPINSELQKGSVEFA